jgi:hypothetical protein
MSKLVRKSGAPDGLWAEKGICSICHEEYEDWGNNAWPVNDGRCCGYCNGAVVIPTRLRLMREQWAAEAAQR